MFNKKLLFLLFLSFMSLSASSQFSEALKQKKIYPMGKKVYDKICKKDIKLQKYSTIDELKTVIKKEKLCKQTKDKYFQALVLYLWEVKRVSSTQGLPQTIKITKDEKCPVCGMFLHKYPRWVTQIFYTDRHLSFDGVKDMMKFYFKHKKGISKILVTDYYSQKVIDARKAYYVMGSDIYGPMGEELIPFSNIDEAKRFQLDHKGRKILKFTTVEEVY